MRRGKVRVIDLRRQDEVLFSLCCKVAARARPPQLSNSSTNGDSRWRATTWGRTPVKLRSVADSWPTGGTAGTIYETYRTIVNSR